MGINIPNKTGKTLFRDCHIVNKQSTSQYKLASLYRKAPRHSTINSLKLYCQCVINFAMVKSFIYQNKSYVATFSAFSLTLVALPQTS